MRAAAPSAAGRRASRARPVGHAALVLAVLALAGCQTPEDAPRRPAASAAAPMAAAPLSATAEELVRLQAIPLSQVTTFEQHYTSEDLDLLAWLMLRALDTSGAWTPRAPTWNLYRANIRNDIERMLRRGWLDFAGAIRSLAAAPPTSLARFYADALTADEIDELVAFHRSAPGRAYGRYVTEIKRTTRRGAIEIDRAVLDLDPDAAAADPAAARRPWLEGLSLGPGDMPAEYAFHVATTLRDAMPDAGPATALLALRAGAPPGSEAFRRLDSMLGAQDRGAVERMLASPAAVRAHDAQRRWLRAVAEREAVLPPMGANHRGLQSVLADWKALRARPGTLPRSAVAVDPVRVAVPDAYALLPLADSATAAALKRCMPSLADSTIQGLAGPREGRPADRLEQLVLSRREPNMILTRRGLAACVQTTAPGFPIPALNSFASTIRVVGMGEADTRAWRSRIAQEIAAFGVSESLVVMTDGAAFEVIYAVDLRAPDRLVYASRFLPPGSYERRRYRTAIDGAAWRSVAVSTAAEPGEIPLRSKSLISTREDERWERERATAQ